MNKEMGKGNEKAEVQVSRALLHCGLRTLFIRIFQKYFVTYKNEIGVELKANI